MCDKCASPEVPQSRRNFLKLAGASALALGLGTRLASAAAPPPPPRPQNVISPDGALDRLMKGNERYRSGSMKRHDILAERPALVGGQNPFAGILSCADSRVAPEYAFDTGRGDLFVCRVAGNFANKDSVASFEYGVAVLGVPLILVLGHRRCGAIESTIKAVQEGVNFPGHIPSLIKGLRPAVKAAEGQPGNLLENAIEENVRLTCEKLRGSGPILNKALKERRLQIIGGVYELETGRIDLLA